MLTAVCFDKIRSGLTVRLFVPSIKLELNLWPIADQHDITGDWMLNVRLENTPIIVMNILAIPRTELYHPQIQPS